MVFVSEHGKIQINNAKTKNEIIEVLNSFGLNEIAKHISYLDNLIMSELNCKPIQFKSLQGFTTFVINGYKVPKTQIDVSSTGLLITEWENKTNDRLSIQFLDEKHIRFLFSSGPHSEEHVVGNGILDNMLSINRSLIERFESR